MNFFFLESKTQSCSGGGSCFYSLSASSNQRFGSGNSLVSVFRIHPSIFLLLFQRKYQMFYVCRIVMASSLPSHLLSFLTPDSEFGLGAAIECAWCLHYLVSRWELQGIISLATLIRSMFSFRDNPSLFCFCQLWGSQKSAGSWGFAALQFPVSDTKWRCDSKKTTG